MNNSKIQQIWKFSYDAFCERYPLRSTVQDKTSRAILNCKTGNEKVSYYGLINGYKDIFKDPATSSFYPGTTFDDIYNLYLFDAELRDVFLKSSEISPCSPPYLPNAIRTSFSNDCANLSSSSSVRFLGPLI